MPDSEFEEGLGTLYKDKYSEGQHLSQAAGSSWPLFDYNQWVGKKVHPGVSPKLNQNNNGLQKTDSFEVHGCESISVLFNQKYRLLTPRPEYLGSCPRSSPLNANESLIGSENFNLKQNQGYLGESTYNNQRSLTPGSFSPVEFIEENEYADSPTLTTNSEKSEITESSIDFNFSRGKEHSLQGQQFGTSQCWPMQQSGYNDFQLLQQQMMLKQLHELQRQQQLQQFGDLRQQNSLNQFSSFSKQATGGQFSPLINGTPVHDAPQMLRNWTQQAASPSMQGMPNKGMLLTHEQGQALRSMGLAPQQLDVSLYGPTVSNTRGNPSQYSPLQEPVYDTVNLSNKPSDQSQKFMTHSSSFGNSYMGDQSNISADLLESPQGAFISKQGFQLKHKFGQPTFDGSNAEAFQGNQQVNNTQQTNASMNEINESQDQLGWPVTQQKSKKVDLAQDSVPLDPLEAKILYNMDDNIWDAFGGQNATACGGFGNAIDHSDLSAGIPSIQSGSWSALMQTAVAEASSSATGVQEWSGLTFQNTEHSPHNQILKLGDGEKQRSWLDNNFQGASTAGVKDYPMILDSSTGSSFPGFLQGLQISDENRKDNGQTVQRVSSSDDAWAGQMFEQSISDTQNHGNITAGKNPLQMSNGPYTDHNSYEAAGEKYENQQNLYQKGNSNDYYTRKASVGQVHFEQSKFPRINFSGAANANEELLPDLRGNLITSDEFRSTGDHGSSLSDCIDFNAQRSEHLELLHKVDQSKDDSNIAIGSVAHNLLNKANRADSSDTSVAKLYGASSSQNHGLGLSSSQKFESTRKLPPGMPQKASNQNPGQPFPDVIEGNQNWSASSFQSLSPSERAVMDGNSGAPGNVGFPFVVPFASNLANAKSMPAASESLQTNSVGFSSRIRPLNQALQDTSQHIQANPVQQFPILEASPVSQPSVTFNVPSQDHFSGSPHNVWRNVPTMQQHPPSNIPGFVSGKENTQREMSLQQDASHSTGYASGSLVLNSQQMPSGIGAISSSERDLNAFGQLQNNNLNYSLLHQVQVMNNSAESVSELQQGTLGGHQFKDHVDKGQNSAPEADLVSQGGTASDVLRSGFQAPQDTVTYVHHHSQTQSNRENLPSKLADHDQVNMHKAPLWFNQYGTLKNGQMVPLSNVALAKTETSLLSPGKVSQNLVINPSLQQSDADQGAQVLASTNQMSIMPPLKRKMSTFEPLPWGKEATQGSKKLRNISVTAQDWAQATNRRFEKVDDQIQMFEVLHPVLQPKRRILLTTQLMQQLFLPAPRSILNADCASGYDRLTYYAARLALGDACSLATSKQDDIFVVKNNKLNSEDLHTFSGSANKKLSEITNKFVERAKMMESDFQRLDRAGSVLDLKLELQELERFAVINRFAKFHVRGQTDASAVTQKLSLQRYVSAFPMPKNLPEGANCHSL